jgi:cytoskeletal protein RodZ
MPVLVLLILIDIAVMGILMYFVLSEKPKHHTTPHPYVTEAEKPEEKGHTWAVETISDKEAAEKAEEKTDQPS